MDYTPEEKERMKEKMRRESLEREAKEIEHRAKYEIGNRKTRRRLEAIIRKNKNSKNHGII